ncbi:ent-kaur-16-ene synthase chloroplastic-like [Prunus yedoensis var. nudiflora]|uniref:Ent-kaur-16-ene synthase chloroplastic-like n=1 Tax=Prunus yedoensis var. nudiflora TaxID=2094558 RepID=A0A314ZDP3_PRUYE|nr:ent-kaur-16-ene synthase chloroplastic-like [Prunus yedoensis var. nudiflora]
MNASLVLLGLRFIESNLASATDEEQRSPVGFNIIFPAMIASAMNFDMYLPLGAPTLDALFHRRDFELKRGYGSNSEGWRTFLAYISEGLGSQDWELVMKYQKKNGSLFNLPSTTAAAFTQLKNADCLKYLRALLEKCGNAVPTVYPLDNYARLSMVARLESLGIDRHFREEIRSVLDETYRSIKSIFRRSFLQGYMKDISAALEFFKASEIIIHPDESVLEKQNNWMSHFLKQELSNTLTQARRLNKHIGLEVDDALKFPFYASLGRLSSRRAIKSYNTESTRILKSSYSCLNIGNEDFLKLAVEDFNICQSIHHKELNHLARWDVNVSVDCCSEHVEIIFSALKNTINEIGVKAFARQGRSVTSDIIETWLDLLKSGLKEAEWLRNKSVPTMEEYYDKWIYINWHWTNCPSSSLFCWA